MKTIKTTRISPPTTGYRRPTTGFTLMELLIAIGILAVGGAMAAALFPAAIKENQSSYNDTLGTIICENALATIKARLTTTVLANAPMSITTTYKPILPALISFADRSYPTGITSDLGFMALAKQPTAGVNDYYFVIISYNQTPGESAMFNMIPISADIDPDVNYILVSDSDANMFARLGTPVIVENNSEYAYVTAIVDISGGDTKLVLDRKLNSPIGTYSIWVVLETGATTRSPAMNVLVARTALRTN